MIFLLCREDAVHCSDAESNHDNDDDTNKTISAESDPEKISDIDAVSDER